MMPQPSLQSTDYLGFRQCRELQTPLFRRPKDCFRNRNPDQGFLFLNAIQSVYEENSLQEI